MRSRKKINWGLWALAVPGLIFLFAIYFLPMFGLVIPFKDVSYAKGIWGSDWSDPILKNFQYFFKSQDAWQVTWNTISMNFVFIFITMLFAVTLAIMMFELRATQVKVFQTCLFVPYFISWVVASYVVYAMLCPDMGVFPQLCKSLGLTTPNFYNEAKYWKIILPVCYIWKNIGYNLLLFYAVLMGLDTTQFEAAAIDGASRWQRIWYIILPYMKPTVILLSILQIGKIFYADFGLFYFVPRNSGTIYSVTDVLDTYVYRALRVTGDIGLSSAMGLYQSLVGFLLVLITNFVVKKIDKENALF